MDSNHRTPKRTDLQSVAVGHLAIPPAFLSVLSLKEIFFQELPENKLNLTLKKNFKEKDRASGGIRTPDLLITNQ